MELALIKQLFSNVRNKLFPVHLIPKVHGVLTLWMRTPGVAGEFVGTKVLNSKALSLGSWEPV